ncbi:MAG: 5-formyltetrahydrofolate cyclo-ligase [Ruminococcaceae bacterium]|nr:5-formyltetrahydrofolate cyclo-ligase [Oscillospiraceae bacterium]
MISKKEARKIIKEKRAGLSPEFLKDESKKIADCILQSEYFTKASKIMCYASVRGEVDTFYLMKKILESGKTLALPVTVKKEMTFYRVESLEKLIPGYMGIAEPERTQVVLPDEKTLMIMPGVAFDTKCHRAGYGAGCYDRYLEDKCNFMKIAPAFQFQVFDEIENDRYDICPDVVILPDGKEYTR